MRELDARWYRSQLGVVSQEPSLFSETVAANIAYGLDKKVSQEEIEEASKLANAHGFITALPQGYQTKVRHLRALSNCCCPCRDCIHAV